MTEAVWTAPDALTAWICGAGLTDAPDQAARFCALCGASGRTATCSERCRCLQVLEWAPGLAPDLPAAGWSAQPVTGVGRSARPRVWFAPSAAGVMGGPDRGAPHRGWTRREAVPATAAVFSLRRAVRPAAGPAARHALGLISGAAHALRPSREVWRPCSRSFGGAVGVAAYGALADALCAGSTGGSSAALCRSWFRARKMHAAHVRARAGAATRPWARRLARAAAMVEEEADTHLAQAARLLTRTGRPGSARAADAREAAGCLRRAAGLAGDAARITLEAGLLALELPAHLRAPLLGEPEDPLTGTELHEVIYLARAWATPFPLLAARRLAGSREHQAIATLTQLLVSGSPAVAQTAAWALDRAGTEEGARAVSAYRARILETA